MVALVYYVIAPHKVFISLSSTVGTLPLLKHFVTVCHQHTPTKEESASDKADREPCIPSLIWRINGEVRNITCLNSELAVSELMRLGHSIGWAATRYEQRDANRMATSKLMGVLALMYLLPARSDPMLNFLFWEIAPKKLASAPSNFSRELLPPNTFLSRHTPFEEISRRK